MWKTYSLWILLNRHIPIFHPFYYLFPLKTPPPRRRRKNKYSRQQLLWVAGIIFIFLVASGQGEGIILLILLFVYLSLSLSLMTIFVLIVTCGAYLAGKITNQLSIIEKRGIYDLISITPNGEQYALWIISRIVYQKTKSVQSIHKILIGILVLVTFLLVLSQINPLLLMTIYIWFMQAIIIGYLVGLWSYNLNTDVTTRIATSVGAFIGSQLIVAIVTIVCSRGLSDLFRRMNWSPYFLLELIQAIGFILIVEMMVRLSLRLVARQSETPYAVWRSELGI